MKNTSFAMLAVIASIILATTAFAQVYPDGMVSYWKFDEGEGSSAFDSVGNNHGTLENNPEWTTGKVGQALDFNGTDTFILVPPHDSLDIAPNKPFTLEAWVNLEKGGVSLLDKCMNEPSNYRWIVGNAGSPGDYTLGVWSSYGARWASTPFSPNVWQHVVTTFDGSNVHFFVDTVPRGSSTWNLGPITTTGPLYIGRDVQAPTMRFVNGIIDELALYNRVLSQEEIEQHYQNGVSGQGYEVAQLECIGFEPPMAAGPVRVKKNRALPHKAYLYDDDNLPVTDADIAALPVIQVLYDSGEGGDPLDVTDDALPAGEGTEGNQFVYTADEKWQFNLKTKNYTASGTYTVTMKSGDESSYIIEPTCEATFVIK